MLSAAPGWQRLDRRMLLVHPVTELVRFLPVVLFSLVLGGARGDARWTAVLVVGSLLLGATRWFTTAVRIDAETVQVRRGLLRRRVLTVPRERIRTVDVDAPVLHRLLGLAVVRVGTGTATGRGSEQLELDALAARDVPALRTRLLRPDAPGPDAVPGPATPGLPAAERPTATATATATDGPDLAHWSPAWVRYAPFGLTGLASLGVLGGVAGQLLAQGGPGRQRRWVREGLDVVRTQDVLTVVAVAVLALLLVASAVAAALYLVGFWGFRLTARADATLHTSHGLLRTRQTTVDRARLRGVEVAEPLLPRAVGAARLTAVSTGVTSTGRRGGAADLLLPTAPRAEVDRVAAAVLGDADPLRVPLARHGAAARRRRFTRVGAALLVAAVVVAALARTTTWGPVAAVVLAVAVPVGAVLAESRYRGLGHAVLGPWVVVRRGALDRRRVVLERAGVIGVTLGQSITQRWAGVVTLRLVTAAGRGRYDLVDLPLARAWWLVEQVSPGLADPVDNPARAGSAGAAVCQGPGS